MTKDSLFQQQPQIVFRAKRFSMPIDIDCPSCGKKMWFTTQSRVVLGMARFH